MGIFDGRTMGRSPSKEEEEDEIGEENAEKAVVLETKTKEKDYTVHEATATFADGSDKDYTFDGIKRKDGALVLYDYNGYNYNGFNSKATDLIPYNNLRDFDTTKRRPETMKVDYTQKHTMLRSDAEDLVEENDNMEIVKIK